MKNIHANADRQFFLKDHVEKLYPFKLIAETQSFTLAAQALGLSQSSLSHTVKLLEELLDAKLLDRKPKQVTLTAEGEVLYQLSVKVFHLCNHAELEIQNGDALKIGFLRVATHETLATNVWPGFIRKMNDKFPDTHFSFISGRVDQAIKDVIDGKVDLALTVEPVSDSRIEKVQVYSGELSFYVAAHSKFLDKYPALKSSSMNVEKLSDIPLLTDSHAHLKQGLPIPQYLRNNGIQFTEPFQLNSFEASIKLCAQGLGVCFIPKMTAVRAAEEKIREIKLRGLKNTSFGQFEIYASYLTGNKKKVSFVLHELKREFTGT